MPMSPRLLRPRASSALVAVDADARTYINAVRIADGGQYMEAGVQRAIDAFVTGCKSDGIWTAIKASCLLAGPRTLAGILTPLVGSAPTNVSNNFVSGDYDRKTGLLGNGSNKNLDSGRANNADPQDSKHAAVWQTTHHTRSASRAVLGSGSSGTGETQLLTTATQRFFRANHTSATVPNITESLTTTGFWGVSRQVSTSVQARFNGTTTTLNDASTAPSSNNILVFSRLAALYSDGRIAFYSIGTYLDLALLESRVSAYVTAIGAAIP